MKKEISVEKKEDITSDDFRVIDQSENSKGAESKVLTAVLVTAVCTSVFVSVLLYIFFTSGLINPIRFNKQDEDKFLHLKKVIAEIDTNIDEAYLGDIKKDDQYLWAAKGYTKGLKDPYTEYFSKEEWKSIMDDLEGEYVGIGVAVREETNGNITIVEIFDGGSAKEVGFQIGDTIFKVNGEIVEGQNINQVTSKMKGKENTKVNITVKRKNKEIEKTLVRKHVKITHVVSKVLDKDIGYIGITQFDTQVDEDFKKEIKKLEEQGIKKLVIDVRGNTGGELNATIGVTEVFVPKGKTIFKTRSKNGQSMEIESRQKENVNMQVVILGDEGSASASEILIAALTENGIAKFVGEKTFGKGVIQEVRNLKNGGVLKLTTQEYLTPKGNVINKKGIKPDIEVKLDEEKYIKDKVDVQLNKAIEVLKSEIK